MARTARTNLSLRDAARCDQTAPQKGVLRGARFAVLLHRGVTTVRITKHLGLPQCHIAFRPCNACIIGQNANTDQRRCGPEKVNHRRRPATAELIMIWGASGPALCPIGSRAGPTSAPSSTRHRKGRRVPCGKETMKDALGPRREAASATAGGKQWRMCERGTFA
ncbi:hypothetical protein TCSYLVIO_009403, partial [Trypanosoma cruzi]